MKSRLKSFVCAGTAALKPSFMPDRLPGNLVPRAMPVRGLGLALALGKRNEIRNFIGCREINNLGAA